MKKSFKGFTLIECIVALAILGIASLTMAQIYATVSQRNKMNHLVNTSLTNQMRYVEEYTDSETVPILNTYGGAPQPPSFAAAGGNYVKLEKLDESGNPVTDGTYSYPVNIYVLKSRDRYDNQLSAAGDAGYTEDDYNLRYKYLLGVT